MSQQEAGISALASFEEQAYFELVPYLDSIVPVTSPSFGSLVLR